MTAPRGAVTAAMRSSGPRALAVLVRRIRDLDDAEDALQDALLDAARTWVAEGLPRDPTAWLVTAAHRRWVDDVRSDRARRRRERSVAGLEVRSGPVPDQDDTLALFLLCCHPALPRPSQVALTLRSLGGLSTREIARGLLVGEAAVAQRISRAKATLRGLDPASRFAPPDADELPGRIAVVLDVLAVIHTESHAALEGEEVTRPALADEALRLARELLSRAPADAPWRGEAMGLVAVMLLTAARAPARIDAEGDVVPLADQDRSLWREDLIREGVDLVSEALAHHPLGRHQLRAAIAAVHDEATASDTTDWRQIVALYDLLAGVDPGPAVELGRLVALAELDPAAALERFRSGIRAPHPRSAAVHAHLLDRAGETAAARTAYLAAADAATNAAERRFLLTRAERMPGA